MELTDYHVQLADNQEFTVVASTVAVESGALKFATDGAVTLVVAPRVWRACYPAGTDRLPRPSPPPAAKPAREMPVPPPPPDTLGRR